MEENSTLKGVFVKDESNARAGSDGYVHLTIDETSKWVVTGDSILSELVCKGSIEDENGNMLTIINSDGNVLVNGDSSYTITVAHIKSKILWNMYKDLLVNKLLR